MPSPFPGMDPYLGGYLWPDVHNALAAPVLQPIEVQIVNVEIRDTASSTSGLL